MTVSSTVNTSVASATTAETVTPSDSVIFAPPGRGLFVGTGGTVAVRMAGGGNASFKVGSGSLLPICVDQVLFTGTDAADMVLLR